MGVDGTVTGFDGRVMNVEKLAHNVAVAVSGLPRFMQKTTERLIQLERGMNRIVSAVDALTAESIASRSDRILFNLSFNDHRQALLDHELRLTRLERRAS